MNISLSLTNFLHCLHLVILTFVNFAIYRPYLDFKTASTIATRCIVNSKLVYCNSLYFNLPKSQINHSTTKCMLWINCLQLQNSLSRVVVKAPKSCHISPVDLNLCSGSKFMNELVTSYKVLTPLSRLTCITWSLSNLLALPVICCHSCKPSSQLLVENHKPFFVTCITSSLEQLNFPFHYFSTVRHSLTLVLINLLHLHHLHCHYPSQLHSKLKHIFPKIFPTRLFLFSCWTVFLFKFSCRAVD